MLRHFRRIGFRYALVFALFSVLSVMYHQPLKLGDDSDNVNSRPTWRSEAPFHLFSRLSVGVLPSASVGLPELR